MELASLVSEFLKLQAGLADRERDPLAHFRWASSAQARVWKWLALGYETLARFGNVAGKTAGVAAGVVALCRGMGKLDGQELPQLRKPIVVWVLTKTRRQQVDSVQAEYRRFIGSAPHQIAWDNRAKGYIDSIWIATPWCQHGHDRHCTSCSRVVFHCEQSGAHSFLGGRVDIIHADEPPNELIWREARSRIRAGARLLLVISATPLYRNEWEWMASDFSDCEDRPNHGRVEVRSSLFENRYLPETTRQQLLSNWRGDVLFEARVYGSYVDARGLCPFRSSLLNRFDALTTPPQKVAMVRIETERETADGLVMKHVRVPVEMWWPPERDESYIALLDPSTGIEDKTHDPAGLHVYARRRPRLVARYGGYLEAHGLGVLGAKLGRFYNRAVVDVEVTGGWGRGSLSALRKYKYTNLNRREVELSPGRFIWKLGWDTTAQARAEMMAAIQRMLEQGSLVIPSRAVISTLRGIILDTKGKYLAAPGRHDEDMILLGRFLVWSAERHAFAPPAESLRTTMRRALHTELGRGQIFDFDEDEAPRIRGRASVSR